jgi:hypothetical protein
MHMTACTKCRGDQKKEKEGKLSHVYEEPDSFVRLREASKVYCTTLELQRNVPFNVHYFCTSKAGLRSIVFEITYAVVLWINRLFGFKALIML